MTPAPERPDKACAWCEPLRHDYNAAVANGLIEQARLIDRRIAAHEREVHEHVATAVTPAPERPDPLRRAAENVSDRRTPMDDGFWVSRKEMRALDIALGREDMGTLAAAPVTDAGLREAAEAVADHHNGGRHDPNDRCWPTLYRVLAALSRQAEKETA